ncbi:uncharacterized protein LOC113514032 [Galleria mellonella]|uniref:Uncharacterized protein LOC113514032 n=1 Tax=Galleria mellonella TaxID=7137 RepID=A0ABM3MF74_GALME|nr:uncharacterized protein LOC113514032 [Galleria mellonella]
MEPLQCRGPYVCPSCGGVWCTKCSIRLRRCARYRSLFLRPATPCLALQLLIDDLMLPYRNYSQGCTDLLTATTRAKHEEDCQFNTVICPVKSHCHPIPFKELSAHIESTHDIIAIYSQKIKIPIENFCAIFKKPDHRRTKYRYILLNHKSAFIIKIIFNKHHFQIDVMRKKLVCIAEQKSELNNSQFCALIKLYTQSSVIKTINFIENNTYGRKVDVQWNNFLLELKKTMSITIRVRITNSDTESTRRDYAGS